MTEYSPLGTEKNPADVSIFIGSTMPVTIGEPCKNESGQIEFAKYLYVMEQGEVVLETAAGKIQYYPVIFPGMFLPVDKGLKVLSTATWFGKTVTTQVPEAQLLWVGGR